MTQDYTTSDQAPIHTALARVMSDVRGVAKRDKNQQQGFSFRGIDATLNAVGPALRTHGVITLPTVLHRDTEVVETGKNRTPMKSVTLVVRYRFIGPAGDSLDVEVPGEAMDSGDKAYSKAMSVAMRTALLQTLALPTDEQDPDHEAHERASVNGNRAARPPDPATDQLNVAKIEVTRLGAQLGLDLTGLMADYRAWSDGKELKHADLTALSEYLGSLQARVEAQDAEQAEQGAGDAAA